MAHSHKSWSRASRNITPRTPMPTGHRHMVASKSARAVFHRPGPPLPGHRHNAKEHRIYNMFRRKGYTKSHAWAATEGFAPRSIRASGAFKTTPRQYSTTGRRAAAARRSNAARAGLKVIR